MTQKKSDVSIIGMGLAGMSLGLFLSQNGLSVQIYDKTHPKDQTDMRTTAISHGSSLLFRDLGLWDKLAHKGCPIEQIDIIDGDSPVLLQFEEREVGGPFGWIIENTDLRHVMVSALNKQTNVAINAPSEVQDLKRLKDVSRLIVAADGRGSRIREQAGIKTRGWRYPEKALVAIITHQNPHLGIAIENFTANGPFAALPMLNNKNGQYRSSIVWSDHGDVHQKALECNHHLKLALEARLPQNYGEVLSIDSVAQYPLSLNHAYTYGQNRVALLGDAAHGIHPIAGQGLNLGLRDVKDLSRVVIEAYNAGNDIGSPEILKAYSRARRSDATAMVAATDLFDKLYKVKNPAFVLARKTGMKLVGALPPVKQFFMKRAMGQ